jgi:hypothetical protein
VVTYDSGGSGGVSVVTADLNGDGNLDIAVANSCGTNVTCIQGSIGVLFGAGNGTFAPVTVVNTGYDISDLAVGDVNGDGAMDLAWSSGGNNRAGVLLGNGNGTFQPETVYLLAGIGGRSIALESRAVDRLPP